MPQQPFQPGNQIGAETHWQPGQSANPGGKPKGLLSFSAALRRQLAKTDRRDRTNLDKIAEKVVQMAIRGDMDAIRWLSDRVDGKVAQNLNVNSEQTITVVPWLPAIQGALTQEATAPPAELEGAEVVEEVAETVDE